VEWSSGVEWSGVEWSGVEWSEVNVTVQALTWGGDHQMGNDNTVICKGELNRVVWMVGLGILGMMVSGYGLS